MTASIGPDVLDREHRHDQVGRHVPGEAQQADHDLADEARPLGDRAQHHADGRGHDRVADDGAQARGRDAEAVGQRRVAAAQADQRRAHQRRVAEEDHGVLHDVEEEAEHVAGDREARLADDRGVEDPGQQHRHQEGDEHEDREHGRHDRKQQQLLVGTQDLCAGLDQLPAPGQSLEHGVLLSASRPTGASRCRRRPGGSRSSYAATRIVPRFAVRRIIQRVDQTGASRGVVRPRLTALERGR